MTVTDVNKLCALLRFPPVTIPPKLADKPSSLVEKDDRKPMHNFQIVNNSSATFKMTTIPTEESRKDNFDQPSRRELDELNNLLPTHNWKRSQQSKQKTEEPIKSSYENFRKSTDNYAQTSRILDEIDIEQSRLSARKTQGNEGPRKSSVSRFTEGTGSRRTELNHNWAQQDKENADFFAYLEQFQQETVTLSNFCPRITTL